METEGTLGLGPIFSSFEAKGEVFCLKLSVSQAVSEQWKIRHGKIIKISASVIHYNSFISDPQYLSYRILDDRERQLLPDFQPFCDRVLDDVHLL